MTVLEVSQFGKINAIDVVLHFEEDEASFLGGLPDAGLDSLCHLVRIYLERFGLLEMLLVQKVDAVHNFIHFFHCRGFVQQCILGSVHLVSRVGLQDCCKLVEEALSEFLDAVEAEIL